MFQKLLFALVLCVSSSLLLASITEKDIPDPLKPWQSWVMIGHEKQKCPVFYNSKKEPNCLWPGQLSIQLKPMGASFNQSWQVYHQGWVALPGDSKLWPVNVMLGDRPVAVVQRNNKPYVWLTKGQIKLSGEFKWHQYPESISIPRETGLLKLSETQKSIAIDRDKDGRLWLNRKKVISESKKLQNRLEVKVFRHIKDSIPLIMTYSIHLKVSGDSREIQLGRVVDSGFIPQYLSTKLPARIESNGLLRVQVRAGEWLIKLKVRHDKPLNSLLLNSNGQYWPKQEVWVFQSQADLRVVDVEGVQEIDTNQTNLPVSWKKFPAYLMMPSNVMTLVEKRRGNSEPVPNRLSLKRNIYLDFNGKGYTVQDKITGAMHKDWRLEMGGAAVLGRVMINEQAQFITRLNESQNPGVEIRQGNLKLEADSRINDESSVISAVGWSHDFDRVSATLHLPPGWKLFDATGLDSLSTSWIQKWSLLDLFILLIISLSCYKIWGWKWGALAFVTLLLIYQEQYAPSWAILNVLAVIALVRVLPEGRFKKSANFYKFTSLFIVALIVINFAITQVRTALYPQLEKPWVTLGTGENTRYKESYNFTSGDTRQYKSNAMPMMVQRSENVASKSYRIKSYSKKQQLQKMDLQAKIQTGPGLPKWRWNKVGLNWSGPVSQQQTLKFYFISPEVNRLLGFLRVLLIFGLFIRLLDISLKSMTSKFKLSAYWLVPVVIVLNLVTDNRAMAEMPSEKMLQQLQQRLLEPPKCLPNCADYQNAIINIEDNVMSLKFQIHTLAHVSVPLPLVSEGEYQQVLLNTQLIKSSRRDDAGVLWIQLKKGIHQVSAKLELSGQTAAMTVEFPLRPHHVSVSSNKWAVRGLDKQGHVKSSVQFIRQSQQKNQIKQRFNAGTLPVFAEVERTLMLGLDWEVVTRVKRVTRAGQSMLLKIPLLAGESVTSGNVQVKDHGVLVNMQAKQNSFVWTSILDKDEVINLIAPMTTQWIEVWKLDVGSLWHVSLAGIPVVQQQNQQSQWMPQWRPWPGESVKITVKRPTGVSGPTLTIDKSDMKVTPGLRATDIDLKLTIRSSRGGHHKIQLPEKASLQSIKINNKNQSIRLKNNFLSIPVSPGKQVVSIKWRQFYGISNWFQSPQVDIAINSVNSHSIIKLSKDRWILLAGGTGIGPAILFWGVLIVVLMIAFLLGRSTLTPLTSKQWVLLCLGIAPASLEVSVVIVVWLFALGFRRHLNVKTMNKWAFDAFQVALFILTLSALLSILGAIQQGLLGAPDMSIAGNGSNRYLLQWYLDRSQNMLQQPWVFSVSMIWYRGLMLVWALWLAFALIKWLQWGWGSFGFGGYWKRLRKEKIVVPAISTEDKK
ncbi:MAG: hypothetical protein HN826_14300 [Methylococcales bacterium]|nr:hypothetical protein [Methylococcales bacterium]